MVARVLYIRLRIYIRIQVDEVSEVNRQFRETLLSKSVFDVFGCSVM